MRKLTFSILAGAAALAMSSSAIAQTVTDTNGTPLSQGIFGIAGTGTTVYGSSPNNNGVANVRFTADTTVSIGAGFAQINDLTPNTENFFSLIINPDQDFTAFKFSTMLTDPGGQISVFALGSETLLDPNLFASYTPGTLVGTYGAGVNNFNKLLSGGTFDAFMIRSTSPIAFFEVKQLSFNAAPGAVPEPGTWAMMLIGFGGMGVAMRRRRRTGAQLMQVA